jgi:hypothetical protein
MAKGFGILVLLVLGGVVAFAVVPYVRKPPPVVAPKVITIKRPAPAPRPTPPPPPPAPRPAPPPPKPAPAPKPHLVGGMTEDQVRQVLGAPAQKSSLASPGFSSVRIDYWTYGPGQKLEFVNGKLESWANNAPPAASPESASALAWPSSPVSGLARNRQIYAELKAALVSADVMAVKGGRNQEAKAGVDAGFTQGVRNRYHISLEEQQAILAQGDKEGWPTPAMLFQGLSRGTAPTVGTTYLTGMPLQLMVGPSGQPTSIFELAPGTRVRVAKERASNGSGPVWYGLEPAGRTSGPAQEGWAAGLTVIHPSAGTEKRTGGSPSP